FQADKPRSGPRAGSCLPRPHNGDGGDGLAHRGDPEDRVAVHRDLFLAILKADGFGVRELAVAGDQHDRAGERPLVDVSLERCRHALEPFGREAHLFRLARLRQTLRKRRECDARRQCGNADEIAKFHLAASLRASLRLMHFGGSLPRTEDEGSLKEGAPLAYRIGLLRNGEPLRPYRQARSTALVMPIRGPAITAVGSVRARIANGGRSSASPFLAPVMPRASQRQPGPEQSSRSSARPRRRRIKATPAIGSNARMSTALAEPFGSETKLRHQ